MTDDPRQSALDEARKAAQQAAIDEQTEARAQQDLTDIKELQKLPAFSRYLLRRIKEKRDKISESMLGGIPPDQYLEKLAVYRTLSEVLSMPQNDKDACWKQLHPGTQSKED